MVEGNQLGLLCSVLVLRACIYVQVAEDLSAQTVLGEHAANRLLNGGMRLADEHVPCGAGTLATGVTRVPHVLLLHHLVAREHHLGGVDDHHVVPAIGVGSEIRLVLATEELGDFRGHAAEGLAFSIYQQPLLVGILLVSGDRLVTQCIHGQKVEKVYISPKRGCEDSERMFTTQAGLWTKTTISFTRSSTGGSAHPEGGRRQGSHAGGIEVLGLAGLGGIEGKLTGAAVGSHPIQDVSLR